MAANVFGNPVTDDTAREIYPDKPVITPLDRAKVAYLYINSNGKDKNATQFVENLMSQYGTGIKTGGLFYNATGGPLTCITSHDYHGNVYKVPYPTAFQNGQWMAFLHVRGSIFVGSSAAVVYRGANDQGDQNDYMCSWSVPVTGDNKAYTEVRDKGHFHDVWGVIEDKMGNSGDAVNDEYKGCESFVNIGQGSTVLSQAILTLKGVLNSTDAAAVAACVLPSISASVAADTVHAGTDQAAAN